MKGLVFIISLFISVSSCYQEKKVMQISNQSDFRRIIDKEILWLKEFDVENKFNQYYIIQAKDLLYIINTNRANLYSFMVVYNTISCENLEDEKIIFLESISPQFDISSSYTPTKTPCIVTVDFNSDPKLPRVNGVITKISQGTEGFKFNVLKRGNISQDIISDKNLEIKRVIMEEPKDKVAIPSSR